MEPLITEEYYSLSLAQVGLAALLLLVNVALSIGLQLGLTRSLLVASARMTVQLLLVGLILEWVFALRAPLPVLGIALVMATLAGVTAAGRTRLRFAGMYWDSLLSVLGAAMLVTGAALAGIVRVEPWYNPQYLIPMLGMVLGNILNGINLGLDRFTTCLFDRSALIDSRLALGATRWEAARSEIREALHTALTPAINSMLVMGVVSLPGMMTGQILAGAAPTDAVRYQIVIIFMITSAAALGSLGAILLAYRRLFNARHQFLKQLLEKR
ncbi:ABC transporter permease [Marinobacterium rhizophilum]|uniref:Iron export ABC transporter permease subunit FetB n=1 Tax=Marinobacterium rhizophilum TaxID=420402 RepID=A0ABY5HI41_9GAMM|nr:iron export ABC transporter permease subunit FetB [Marinobacterium rhizophilum]UTW11516.1 iron export ABC transporter permease subunit FetB [Marinobacterium rhizophilum]